MRVLICLVAMIAAVCHGQELRGDPTRPPVDAGSGISPVSTGPRLESVIIPNRGKAKAMINGRLLVVGDEFDGRKVVRIAEAYVLLDSAEGQEKLLLTPDVDKRKKMVNTEK